MGGWWWRGTVPSMTLKGFHGPSPIVRRLYVVYPWTPTPYMLRLFFMAVFATEARARTEEDEESARSNYAFHQSKSLFHVAILITYLEPDDLCIIVVAMPPCRDSLLWCRLAAVDELEHRLPLLHPAEFRERQGCRGPRRLRIWLPSYRSPRWSLPRCFGIDVSMISASSVEVTSASAVLITFSAAGSGLSVSSITEGFTQRTGLFNLVFDSKGLSYTVFS